MGGNPSCWARRDPAGPGFGEAPPQSLLRSVGLRLPWVGRPRAPTRLRRCRVDTALCTVGVTLAPWGLGRRAVLGCACSGFELLKSRKRHCCFRDGTRFSVHPGLQPGNRHPATAADAGGADTELRRQQHREEESSSAGLPTALGGLWAPLACVLDAATCPSCAGSLRAPGGCVSPPGRPRNSRDLPHPAWQRPGLRGLRAPGGVLPGRWGRLFWMWPPEARSELFPVAPEGPSDARPPGSWPAALATSVILRPLPARLTPGGLRAGWGGAGALATDGGDGCRGFREP